VKRVEKSKVKQPIDILALPQKERAHLCQEIRGILQQRVLEEKDLTKK